MNRRISIAHRPLLPAAVLLAAVVLTPGFALGGENPAKAGADAPTARFRGKADDLVITNQKWEPGTKEYSFVTFDLSWSPVRADLTVACDAVSGEQASVGFTERAFVAQDINVLLGRDHEVIVTLRAHPQLFFELFDVQYLAAEIALLPQPVGDGFLLGGLDAFFCPLEPGHLLVTLSEFVSLNQPNYTV